MLNSQHPLQLKSFSIMTQWTSQQLKCLEAIGVPVYTHEPAVLTPSSAPATNATATAKTSKAKQDPQVQKPDEIADTTSEPTQPAVDSATYYNLGPWVLEFSQTIPVESYDWLRDLAAYCQSKPVQVSASTQAVNTKPYGKNQLSSAEKKALWGLLKSHLKAAKT
ncbi:MAG: hypothetical protein JJU03_05815 [Idiomarina sp.]|nr:hypothetical protein [Idiomarina sp.]